MTEKQRALIEKVRQALYDDPKVPSSTYIFGGHSYASYISRADVIEALEEFFKEEGA